MRKRPERTGKSVFSVFHKRQSQPWLPSAFLDCFFVIVYAVTVFPPSTYLSKLYMLPGILIDTAIDTCAAVILEPESPPIQSCFQSAEMQYEI